jgi:hypothetical protein
MKTLADCKLIGTTDASGDLTLTGEMSPAGGLLYAVEWVDGDLADGVDAVLSCFRTGSSVNQTLLTLTDANDDKWYYPRVDTHDNTGTANGGADYAIINGILKLVISSGGNAKTGGAIVWYWKP